MTDTDSSTPVEEPVVLSKDKKKKKHRKHKKKRRRDAAADDDDDRGGSSSSNEEEDHGKHSIDTEEVIDMAAIDDDGNDSTKHKREKKSKKKKKDKKRKRSSSPPDDGDDSSCNNSNNKKSSKKKRKKSSSKQRSKDKQKEMDEKVVSSSAIEYYPEDLKHLQLKKNQETAVLEKNMNTVDESKLKRKASSPNNDATTSNNTTMESKTKGDKNATATKEGDSSTTKQKQPNDKANNITLLLFYQYVEPPWDETQFQTALQFVTDQGQQHNLTGRMRVAREGLNCTLTGSHDGIRAWCAALRTFDGGRSKTVQEVDDDGTKTTKIITEFANTEFKLTDDLPPKQCFPKLHAFEVIEIVNYGLAGHRAPSISQHGGTHLEPHLYHEKMHQKDTVIIDVRNHYEANIGRFDPPKGGAHMIDPKMRKSTEFPLWLDRKETKEMLRGKQVLMYCTGGVRCERASALLKQKIDQEEDTKELGIKGVYQLQGGVDKYFKAFPEGGLWKGKNYTFDKRFAHAPPAVEAVERTKKVLGGGGGDEGGGGGGGVLESSSKKLASSMEEGSSKEGNAEVIMGKCEACLKPWDMYRGKRRCPTCGVPSLICRDCFEADKSGTKKLGREVRCDLCVADNVRNKRELREREEREMKEYEQKLRRSDGDDYAPMIQRKHAITRKPKANPERVTRLFLKNMCARQMDESKLLEIVHPARVTHIQWLTDRNTGKFYGSAFIEVKTAEDAGSVLALDGTFQLGRKMKVKYQKHDEKDIWPIPNTEVSSS